MFKSQFSYTEQSLIAVKGKIRWLLLAEYEIRNHALYGEGKANAF